MTKKEKEMLATTDKNKLCNYFASLKVGDVIPVELANRVNMLGYPICVPVPKGDPRLKGD